MADKGHFVMLVGIAGSGKSTVARRLQEISEGRIVLLSSDDIREELYGDASIQTNPAAVFTLMNQRLFSNLTAGRVVIYDATNLKRSRRMELLKQIKALGDIDCDCITFYTDLQTCIDRQGRRDRQVPEEVIRRQHAQLEPVDYSEGWDFIWDWMVP